MGGTTTIGSALGNSGCTTRWSIFQRLSRIVPATVSSDFVSLYRLVVRPFGPVNLVGAGSHSPGGICWGLKLVRRFKSPSMTHAPIHGRASKSFVLQGRRARASTWKQRSGNHRLASSEIERSAPMSETPICPLTKRSARRKLAFRLPSR